MNIKNENFEHKNLNKAYSTYNSNLKKRVTYTRVR